jgi:hypothetical protein
MTDTRNRTRIGLIVLVAVLGWMCLGMGNFGEKDVVTKIPRPDRSFRVELVDADDVSFAVRDFSMDGLTLIPVEAGKAKISLDFAEIEEARMNLRDDHVLADIRFRNGSSSEFHIKPDIPFYGLTDWGKLKIEAGDVRRITFKHQAGQKDQNPSPAD